MGGLTSLNTVTSALTCVTFFLTLLMVVRTIAEALYFMSNEYISEAPNNSVEKATYDEVRDIRYREKENKVKLKARTATSRRRKKKSTSRRVNLDFLRQEVLTDLSAGKTRASASERSLAPAQRAASATSSDTALASSKRALKIVRVDTCGRSKSRSSSSFDSASPCDSIEYDFPVTSAYGMRRVGACYVSDTNIGSPLSKAKEVRELIRGRRGDETPLHMYAPRRAGSFHGDTVLQGVTVSK
uniref:Uncharacterized protein n=1 Tax=Ascaris lumbricoides TaxID=6252 RepID=A0A9J2PAT5_ASCLU